MLALVALVVVGAPLPAAADDEDHAKMLFLRGKDLVRKGDFVKAAQMFEDAILKDITEVAAMRLLGRVRERLHNYDLAITAYRQYVEMVPTAPDAYAIRDAIKRCSRLRHEELQRIGGRHAPRDEFDLPRGMRPGGKKAKVEARRR